VTAYSGGGAWDSLRGRFLIFGGGHNDYYGNEVYALYPSVGQTLPTGNGVVCRDATSPTICRLMNPTIPNNNSAYPSGTTPMAFVETIGGSSPTLGMPNAPNSRHTYQTVVYAPDTDEMLVFGGGLAGNSGQSTSGEIWALNLAGLATNPDGANWTRLSATATYVGAYTPPVAAQNSALQFPFMLKHPTTANLFYAGTMGANRHFWSYNRTTNTVTDLSAGGVSTEAGATAVMYPLTERIYFIGPTSALAGNQATTTGTPAIYRMSYASGTGWTTTSIYASTGGCSVPASATAPGVAYDSATQKIVIWPNFGNIVYEFDPADTSGGAEGTCTAVSFGGSSLTSCGAGSSTCPADSTVSSAQYTSGTFTRFSYAPALDQFVLVHDSTVSAHTLSLISPAPSTANTITIKNEGTTATDYPVQIGRAFAQGEITSGQLPQAYISGTGYVSTQIDIKTRWADNSLKHAIISFLIPTFTSGQTYTVYFAAGTTVGNTAITKASMLADYDFDAVISLTKTGVTKTASARTMLNADHYTVWASGPIATTILLGNHANGYACVSGAPSGAGATTSAYDFGFTSYCAFRPLFQATFWAGINKVFVRYIGEIANTEQLEDVVIDSGFLTSGSASPATIYTRASALTMNGGTRWTKTAWIGGTPPVGAINHNLAYLASAKALPNYDTSKTISEATLASVYSTWTAASKDLYQKGVWDASSLSSGGGKAHVGPFPAWTVRWFYSGDYRAQEIAIGQAELGATIEFHYREGKAGKKLDQSGLVDGVGYPISISGRPTMHLVSGLTYGAPADDIVAVGTLTATSWGFDGPSHGFETFAPVYLLTGDYFFLEEAMFLAGHHAAFVGADTVTTAARGPTGAEGGIADKNGGNQQLRGQAWNFRNRVETVVIVPDSNPFKAYLDQLTVDAIAFWEGQRQITTGLYNGNTLWTFANQKANPASGQTYWDATDCSGSCGLTVSPLRFWSPGNGSLCDSEVNEPTASRHCISNWMQNYVIYALGRGKELGYATEKLLEWAAPQITGPITDAGYNPWLVMTYRIATIPAGTYQNFTSWAQVKASFLTDVQNETSFEPGAKGTGTLSEGDFNAQTVIAATSMIADQTNGATAWTWASTNILPSTAGDLKWAILPRTTEAGSTNHSRFSGTFRGVLR
jgi:hypothetical protein